MSAYIARRLLLILPTLFGILLINFCIIQAAPGGPVEQMIATIQGHDAASADRTSGGSVSFESNNTTNNNDYRGAQGLPPEIIEDIRKLYGFDKPAYQRFFDMLVSYATFDFGDSFFRNTSVIDLILEKMPVTISLGLWSTLLIYLISIPTGIYKAVSHGSRFDIWTSFFVVIASAVPSFLLGILFIVLFAGGSFLDWFPLRGLTSPDFADLSWFGKIKDYFWHLALPLTAYTLGGFATLTLLTKNSFLDEINKQYVTTAKAKGLTENTVLYKHVFRNAMLIIISGFPAAFFSIFVAGSLLIEVIFSLDGLGLLGFESILNRDYPVIFGTLFIFTLFGLVIKLISDLLYVLIDPRIDFESRKI
ncbi:MAG: microcin C transport system permease protein [Candidatus Endobugula sp.]|jgi:microcin C transport system permease protein